MTGCVLSGVACAPPVDERAHEPDRERGLLCCAPSLLRLASALNVIPERVEELLGLGYVERDLRRERCSTPACFERGKPVDVIATVRPGRDLRVPGVRLCADCAVRLKMDGRIVEHVAIPVRPADPVAYRHTAGPVPGQRGGAKVHAAPSSVPPLSLDVVDLASGVNHEARRLLARGVLGLDDDQVGHLSAATILHGWVRDWAEIRREGEPMPSVRDMARWLADRLDWAAASHPALDEFAAEVLELRGVLNALTGRSEPRPEERDRPCPSCGTLALVAEPDSGYVVCGCCGTVMTEGEYAEYLRDLIKEVS